MDRELTPGNPSEGGRPTSRSEVLASHGMVATSHPLASQVGLDILKDGGSAMDAAIGANAALGLMEPVSNGIGGDLFAIVWDPELECLRGFNGSGRSPMNLTKDVFAREGISEEIPLFGRFSISTPGCVDGWYQLHDEYGSLPMERILKPTIAYAFDGHPVPEIIARSWGREIASRKENPRQSPGLLDTFAPGESCPRKGDIWKNPALGETLALISEDGRDAFYEGSIAKAIDAYMREIGAFLSYEDMANHRGSWVEPVCANYRGWDVWELPPNGQGIAALQMLNILEGYGLADYGFGTTRHLHAFIEAKKLAYEDRAKFYADPDFSDAPVEMLLSKDYASKKRSLIDLQRSSRQYCPGVLERGDTVYLCAADSRGMMVSLIQSNFIGIGSGVCVPQLGFGFQNRGASFNFVEGHANEYQPGKRPFHTIIPAFITEGGKPLMAFGVMGGSMQPQGHVQVIVNMKDFGMNLQEAGDAPRVNHAGSSQPFGSPLEMTNGGIVYLENGFSETVRTELAGMGHRIDMASGKGLFGGYQGIWRNPTSGVYTGASESRKDGQAVGY
jgi:gamma-glutamyltranspeptidase/glutathione hydrolase